MKLFTTGLIFLLSLSVTSLSARPRRSRSHHPAKAHHSVLFFSGHNSFEAETYFNFENNAGVLTMSHPSWLFRYGLKSVIEFRLNLDFSTVVDLHTGLRRTGLMPLQPGIKFRFNEPRKFLPAFSITASVTIPKAANAVMSQTYYAPSFLLSAEQDITSKLSFEYSAGMQWDADNFNRLYSAAVNFEDDVTTLSTFYGDVYLFKDEFNPIDIRADVGFNQTISSGLQFDFSAGTGFTNNSPEFFFSTGFVFSAQRRKKNATSKSPGIHIPLDKKGLN